MNAKRSRGEGRGEGRSRKRRALHSHSTRPSLIRPTTTNNPQQQQDGVAGDFEWLTYAEVSALVAKIASCLAGLGLSRQSRVGVYGANCEEWMVAMQACNRMAYECVPLYDSLGENAIEFIVGHSEQAAVFVAAGKLGKLAKALEDLVVRRSQRGRERGGEILN